MGGKVCGLRVGRSVGGEVCGLRVRRSATCEGSVGGGGGGRSVACLTEKVCLTITPWVQLEVTWVG